MKIQGVLQLQRKMKNNMLDKPYSQVYIAGTQGAFSDEVTPETDGFTDEPVVQCDVRVVKNTFVDDSK